ncbi:MAG TPA: nuclear transport factor 2 family protein [Aggregatilineales bacterium]|nr:nuclear transport factor 2 family protein [Aggregatilineales bacterium]
MPQTPDDIERQILALDDRWNAATIAQDLAVYNDLLADDFISISTGGTIATKAQRIAAYRSPGDFIYQSITSDHRQVRVYGEAAILTGHALIRGLFRGGAFSSEYCYTHVFVHLDGRWQAVSAQMTRVETR